MRNTIITTILLFIAVLGASLYYFANVNGNKKETIRPLTFLPQETFVVATFRNDETVDNIFKDFEIFEAIIGKTEMDKWREIKSIFVRDQRLQPYLNGAEIYVSQHPDKGNVATLFTLPTAENIPNSQIDVLIHEIGKDYNIHTKDTLGLKIYSLDHGVTDSIFQIVYHEQIFFASYSNQVIKNVIDPNSPKLNKDAIDYFIDNNSRNSPLSVYFVHDQIKALENTFMRNKPGDFLQLFNEVGGQSAWNISFKNDALILSGESESSHNKENYLELFGTQSKTTQRLQNYFPENTSSFLSFALSDRSKFNTDLQELFKVRSEFVKMEAQRNTLSKNNNLDWENDIRSIFSNEFAVIEQSNRTALAFLTLQDSAQQVFLKDKLSSNVSDSIYRFNHSNIPYMLYGDPLQTFSRPYFACIDNVVVLSNHLSLIQTYLKDIENGNRLVNSLGYKNFEKTQGNEANITYFLRTEKSGTVLNRNLKPAFFKKFNDKENFGFKDFYSWSIQISGNNGTFSSNVYAIYKSKNALGATPEWTYEFDNRPITQPWVFEHSDTSKFIFIQEQDHTVHGIHPNGSKMWSTVLQGRIVGQAQQLEDRSIVFVTDRSRLYRITPDGETLPGFSTGLKKVPSYTPTIARLENEDFIFIPTDNEFLVYDMEGNSKQNWKDYDIRGDILYDIKIHNDKIFLATDSGYFYQFDANGELIKQEHITGTGFNAPIATGENQEKQWGVFAIDTASTLYFLDFKNEPLATKIGDWSPKVSHSFGLEKAGDLPQLYSIEDKKLFSQGLLDSTITYDYNFTQTVEDKPQFFRNDAGNYLIGIASRGNAMIYLFDTKGNLQDGFPIGALPDFYYGKINYNSGLYLLCVQRNNKLYAYKN